MCVGFHLGGEQRLGSRLRFYHRIYWFGPSCLNEHTHTHTHAHTHKILRLPNARKHLGTVCVYVYGPSS
jgi:hypothetical protein